MDSQCLSLPHDILRLVFKCLNGMDLSSASIVCRSWLKAANDEMRTRRPVYIRVDEEYRPLLADFGLSSIIGNLKIRPKLGFFWNVFQAIECPAATLPLDSCIITTTGCLDKECLYYEFLEIRDPYSDESSSESDDSGSQPEDVGETYYGFLSFLPLHGVDITPFVLWSEGNPSPKSLREFYYSIEQALNRPQIQETAGRCAIILSAVVIHARIKKIVNAFNRCNTANTFCLWGGTVGGKLIVHSRNHCKFKSVCGKPAFCAAVVMTGDFQCWSTTLDETHNTLEKVEKKIVDFRTKINLKRHSVAFMFTPGLYYTKKAAERKRLFKQIFPQVPVLHCYGEIVFGNNTVEHNSKEKNATCCKTAFMVITCS